MIGRIIPIAGSELGAASFQPSELAKPALILFLAFFLESRVKAIDDWRHTLLPAIVPVALFALLIVKQPDLGTAVVCVGVTAAIFYVAGMRLRYFGYALLPIIPSHVLPSVSCGLACTTHGRLS